MGYVRTKDKILYVGDLIKDEYGNYCYKESLMYDKGRGVEINVNEILKQADTIEELCDGFIFKDTCANELHLVNQNGGISMLGATLFKETLRGFIETNTGLIYVAKLNDKGEFELL